MTARPWDALEYYRRLVSLLYREIGIMDEGNHPEIAERRRLQTGFFPSARKYKARQIYQTTLVLTEPVAISAPFVAETGLTLGDIHRAFQDGDWQTAGGYIAYGGPKWAAIAQATLDLRDALETEDTARQAQLLDHIDTLCHNSGHIVDKFSQLD